MGLLIISLAPVIIIVGYVYFRDKYEKEQFTLKIKALVYPILLHGIYDFILMSEIVWLTGVFFLFVVFLYFFGLKRVKHLSNQSIYKTDYELLNQKLSKPDQR